MAFQEGKDWTDCWTFALCSDYFDTSSYEHGERCCGQLPSYICASIGPWNYVLDSCLGDDRVCPTWDHRHDCATCIRSFRYFTIQQPLQNFADPIIWIFIAGF